MLGIAEFRPGMCSQCDDAVSLKAAALGKELSCTKCLSTDVLPYDKTSFPKGFVDGESVLQRCPACRTNSMSLKVVGLWD